MAATPQSILQLLLAPVNGLAKQAISRRVDAMNRELAFLQRKGSDDLAFIEERGWTTERLQVVFALNSVYQLVIGPQEAASHANPHVLGSSVPVAHGTFVVDASFQRRTRSAVEAFFAICSEAGMRQELMTLATCRDVVYWVARYEKDEGDDGTKKRRPRKRK